MSSPDPRGHDRSDADYGEKPNVSSRTKAIHKVINKKKRFKSRASELIDQLKSHKGESPLAKLKRLTK